MVMAAAQGDSQLCSVFENGLAAQDCAARDKQCPVKNHRRNGSFNVVRHAFFGQVEDKVCIILVVNPQQVLFCCLSRLNDSNLRRPEQAMIFKELHAVDEAVPSERMAFAQIVLCELFVETYYCLLDQSDALSERSWISRNIKSYARD